MANHKSALKNIRSDEKKRLRNRLQHKTMRNALKDFQEIKTKGRKKSIQKGNYFLEHTKCRKKRRFSK